MASVSFRCIGWTAPYNCIKLISKIHRPIIVKELKEDEEIEEDDQEVNLDKIEEEMEAYYSSEGEDNDMVWVPGAAGASSTAPAQGERSAVRKLIN